MYVWDKKKIKNALFSLRSLRKYKIIIKTTGVSKNVKAVKYCYYYSNNNNNNNNKNNNINN